MGVWKHRLSDIDEELKTAICACCGFVDVRWLKKAKRWQCRKARREYEKTDCGFTRAERDEFLKNKFCEVCGSEDQLVIDHDHRTLVIRGVLCNKHNVALGLSGDSLEGVLALVAYLLK